MAAPDNADSESIRRIDVHTLPVDSVYQRFSTSPTLGLESVAVARLTQTFGKNIISPPKTQYWKKLLNYIFGGFNFLMWIAFIVTILSYKPLGEPIFYLGVAILLLLVITVSATFYVAVDVHSSRIMKSIRNSIAEEVTVIRNGELQTVPSVDIVVGDIVLLTLGDRVPADIRIVEASSDLHFDRSLLTGERYMIPGTVKSTSDNAMETHNLALNSTIVVQGKCTGVVFATGDKTIMGRIVTMSGNTKFKLTAVQKEVWFFAKIISAVALGFYGISLIVWATRSRKNFPGFEKDSSSKKLKIDYASIDRPFPGGSNYFDLALIHKSLYAPALGFFCISMIVWAAWSRKTFPGFEKDPIENIDPDDEDDLEGNKKAKDSSSKKPKIGYTSIDRPFPGGPSYFDLALYYLRRQLQIHKSLYAPTRLAVLAAEKSFDENKQQRRIFLGLEKDDPIENIDPTSTAVAQILEIIPNVEPAHLLQLIETHLPTYSVFHGNRDPDDDGEDGAAAGEREATVEEQVQGVMRHVLHHLFENPDYPKADLRADGKREGKTVGDPDDEDEFEGKEKAKDSSSKNPHPIENIDPTSTAVAQILEIIPNVETAHLLQLIKAHLLSCSVFHENRDPDDDGGEGAAAGEREATVEEQVQGVVGHVLHHLFENPDYPKEDLRSGGKRKGETVGEPDDKDDLEGKAVAQIFEIIPDVEPTHLFQLIEIHSSTYSVFHDPDNDVREGAAAGEREATDEERVQRVVRQVLHDLLFENPDYPKADLRAGEKRKGKTVADPDDEDDSEGKGKAKETSSKKPPPIENIDPTSSAVAQILEIIPNVEPAHLLQLIETHLPAFSVFHGNRDPDEDGGEGAASGEREATVEEQVQGVVRHVLHHLFENPDYPKADLLADGKRKGKTVANPDDEDELEGKGKAKDSSSKKPKIDYTSIDWIFPGSPNYFDLALYYLQTSFPQIFKPYLRRQLQIHKSLYQHTHFSVFTAEKSFDENEQQRRPYAIKSSLITLKKPQAKVAQEEENGRFDAALAGGGNAKEMDETLDDVNGDAVMDVADDDVTGIECQCCFTDYPFSEMVQCPEAHLFCSTCISNYASTQLGTHNSSLTCIHPSLCSLPFPTSELKRILSVKLFELYERLEQLKEIRQAGLVNLEECPFCEWKCVLEALTEEDNLFRCGNEEGGCGVVSCRGCKKLDHLPKSCKEVEEDKLLDGRHAIEEAMTRALMRNCPNCQKAFIKEEGCNSMSCPNCHTLSCYICRQVIKGYDHFNQQPGSPSTSADANKCILFEAVEERHAQEVKEAAEKAMEEYRRDHPDIPFPLPAL